MTNKELRKRIEESDDREWLESLEITVSFDYIGFNKTYKGVFALYEFVNGQVEGWEKLGENIPDILRESLIFFRKIEAEVLLIVKLGRKSEYGFNSGWNFIENQFSNTSVTYPLLHNSKEAKILLFVFVRYPDLLNGVRDYLVDHINLYDNSRDYSAGILLGCDIKKNGIIHRRLADQRLIEELNTDWKKYILDIESEYNESINTTRGKFEEQLWLEKSANYWRARAKYLKKQTRVSLFWLFVIVFFAATTLCILLLDPPNKMFSSFFEEDKSSAIRWFIVYVTLISFFFTGVRALIKISLSSFHLTRDAEERELLILTYFSMIKSSSVYPADRHLIMQSLFSRADTGLLKDDSSPTMPGAGSIVEKVISK